MSWRCDLDVQYVSGIFKCGTIW